MGISILAEANLINLRADIETVRMAYGRLAKIYDYSFGPMLGHARRVAIARVNALPGHKVLEAGVGTGLALPLYSTTKLITGVDVSADMLRRARLLTLAHGLSNVDALLEMNAQAMDFPDGCFDIAVAMFVASVVPDARALLTELRRVVRPEGTILLVNHFARDHGPIGWLEKKFASVSAQIGWHADFKLGDIISTKDCLEAKIHPIKPMSLFQLIEITC